MSLAAQIRDLIDGGLTNQEIAEQLDCSAIYVRATRSRYLNPEAHRNRHNYRYRYDLDYAERRRLAARKSYYRRAAIAA